MKSTKLLNKKESGMQKNTKFIVVVSKLKRLHDILYARIPDGLQNSARVLWALTFFIVIAPAMVLAENIRTWDSSTTLAPRGFRPIFSINE